MELEEGERITLPCRHCTSVSLDVRVSAGKFVVACPKCGRDTEVRVVPSSEGWDFQTHPIDRSS